MRAAYFAIVIFLLFSQNSNAKTFRMVIVGAKISPLKESGSCWDWCRGSSKRGLERLQRKAKAYARMSAKKLKRIALRRGMTKIAKLAGIISDPTGISLALAIANTGFGSYARGMKMPDAFVKVKLSTGQILKTHVVKNTLVPQWGTTADVDIDRHTVFQFYAWDKDLRHDDPIGRKVVNRIPKKLLRRGGTWRLHFGGVYELEILLLPVHKAGRSRFKRGYYRITVLSANIARQKRNGKGWDLFRGKPDPYAVIKIGRFRFSTGKERNSYNPSWNYSRNIYLTGNETLRYAVYDKDRFNSSDLIGSCYIRPIKRIPFERGLLYRAKCQQILELNIRFKRIR